MVNSSLIYLKIIVYNISYNVFIFFFHFNNIDQHEAANSGEELPDIHPPKRIRMAKLKANMEHPHSGNYNF